MSSFLVQCQLKGNTRGLIGPEVNVSLLDHAECFVGQSPGQERHADGTCLAADKLDTDDRRLAFLDFVERDSAGDVVARAIQGLELGERQNRVVCLPGFPRQQLKAIVNPLERAAVHRLAEPVVKAGDVFRLHHADGADSLLRDDPVPSPGEIIEVPV